MFKSALLQGFRNLVTMLIFIGKDFRRKKGHKA